MEKELKITEENIKAAHETGCQDVKNTLEKLFPEVFKSSNHMEVGETFLRIVVTGGRRLKVYFNSKLPESTLVGGEKPEGQWYICDEQSLRIFHDRLLHYLKPLNFYIP